MKTQSVPLADRGTTAIAPRAPPAVWLTLETPGRSRSHGYPVRNPARPTGRWSTRPRPRWSPAGTYGVMSTVIVDAAGRRGAPLSRVSRMRRGARGTNVDGVPAPDGSAASVPVSLAACEVGRELAGHHRRPLAVAVRAEVRHVGRGVPAGAHLRRPVPRPEVAALGVDLLERGVPGVLLRAVGVEPRDLRPPDPVAGADRIDQVEDRCRAHCTFAPQIPESFAPRLISRFGGSHPSRRQASSQYVAFHVVFELNAPVE